MRNRSGKHEKSWESTSTRRRLNSRRIWSSAKRKVPPVIADIGTRRVTVCRPSSEEVTDLIHDWYNLRDDGLTHGRLNWLKKDFSPGRQTYPTKNGPSGVTKTDRRVYAMSDAAGYEMTLRRAEFQISKVRVSIYRDVRQKTNSVKTYRTDDFYPWTVFDTGLLNQKWKQNLTLLVRCHPSWNPNTDGGSRDSLPWENREGRIKGTAFLLVLRWLSEESKSFHDVSAILFVSLLDTRWSVLRHRTL